MKKSNILWIIVILIVVIALVLMCLYQKTTWKIYYDNGKETTIVYPPGWYVLNVSIYDTPDHVKDAYTAFIPPNYTSINEDTVFIGSGFTNCSQISKATKCTGGRTDLQEKENGQPVFYTFSKDQEIQNMVDVISSKNTIDWSGGFN